MAAKLLLCAAAANCVFGREVFFLADAIEARHELRGGGIVEKFV
jgi:hypothetical protein